MNEAVKEEEKNREHEESGVPTGSATEKCAIQKPEPHRGTPNRFDKDHGTAVNLPNQTPLQNNATAQSRPTEAHITMFGRS